MEEKVYLILPGCDDTNRGDQALIWETVDIAKEVGFAGQYYMLANEAECRQSSAEGIKQVDYILKHPSRIFHKGSNIRYSPLLKLKWALVALFDLITREPLVHPIWRKLLRPLYGRQTKEVLKRFEQADACFVKGGGFLHAHGGFSDTYKIYYFLYHIRLAQSFGADVTVMPNSFGPFKSPFVGKMIASTLSKCKHIWARESISASMLQDGCAVKADVSPDLAFHLQIDRSFDPCSHLRSKGIPCKDRTCVAITARPYRFPGESDGAQKYIKYKQSIADLMIHLDQKGFFPVLVEHVFSEMEHENDMTCIREIESLVKGNCEYGVFSDHGLTCRQMKQIYASFDYTVGTRFHSVIFSLSSGVPSIAITYGGNKGDGIMADLGLERFALPISHLTADSLIRAFDDLTDQRADIESELSVKAEYIKKQREQIIRAMTE